MLKKYLYFLKSRVVLVGLFLLLSTWLPLTAQSRFDDLNTDLKSFGVPFLIEENEDSDVVIFYEKEAEIADIVPDYTRLFETLRFLDTAKNSLTVMDSEEIVFSLKSQSGDSVLIIKKAEFNPLLLNEKSRIRFMDEIKGLLRK